MRKEAYQYDQATKAHRFYLGDGHLVAMASSPTNPAGSFQRLAMHEVPYLKGDKTEGYRYNLTVRTFSKTIRDPLTLTRNDQLKDHDLGQGCHVLVWQNLWTSEENEQIRQCLKDTITTHGVADKTILYGREFLNKGRSVVDMAELSSPDGNAVFEYRYARKAVKGIPFQAVIQNLVLPRLATIFGVKPSDLWCHLVYYPTPDCKLDYHDDGEDGINPHLIASLTYLEYPEHPRAFRVRLKSDFPQKKDGRRSAAKKLKTE
jgi:hypothetical protein